MDTADFPPTAATFLTLLEPMLHNRVDRTLAVVRCEKVPGGYVGREVRLWEEKMLENYGFLAERHDLSRQKEMYHRLQ